MRFLTICRDVSKTPKKKEKLAKEGSDYDTASNSVILENLWTDSDIYRCYKNDSDIYSRQFSDIVPEKDTTKRRGYPPWKASWLWLCNRAEILY